MPKSFLVKKAKHREDQSEEASIANSGSNNESSSTSRDAMLNDKCEDTSRRVHNLSGENTLVTHGKTAVSDKRSEQMFHADRNDTVTMQITDNGEVIPRHMWFFPPLFIQKDDPYAKLCVPTSKFHAQPSTEGNYVVPLLRNERQRRESVLRLSPERKILEDGKVRERVFLGTQPATLNNKHHVIPQHPNCVPPKEYHTIPSLRSVREDEKGERCGIYPLNRRSSEEVFDLMKRKTIEGEFEREKALASARDGHVVNNPLIPEAKKRRSESESLSPKRFRNSVAEWDRDELRPSIAKEGVLVLENSQILEAMRRTCLSPKRVRNPLDQWNDEQRRYDLWEAKRRKSEESRRTPGKDASSDVIDKNDWKQSNTSASQNDLITDISKNNYYHRYYRHNWFNPVPRFFNPIRAAEINGFHSYHDHSMRAKSKNELSSVWFPCQLTPAEKLNGVMEGSYRNHVWNPELKSFNGLLSDAGEKEVFISYVEGPKTMETKWTPKNSREWLADGSLSPNLAKEFSGEKTPTDCVDRFRDLSAKSTEHTACNEESRRSCRSCSPDQSIINTAKNSSNDKKEKTFEHQNLRIHSNFSLLGSVKTCRTVGSLSSSQENRGASVEMADEPKREQLESLSIVNTSECSSGFENVPVPDNVNPLVKRDSDRPVSSVRSPEQNWTNVAVIDEKKHLGTFRLHQDEKEHAVEKPNGKAFSDDPTIWLLNKETKTSNVNAFPKSPAVTSSPPFWTVTNGFAVPSQLRIKASKTDEGSSKGKETSNLTHHHRCEICNSTFPLRRLLNRHLKTHSFYKRYSCSYCEKGFNDTFDLKRHVRTHTGIKPFKCDRCDKSFTQRCSLEAHQSRVHGIVHKFGFRERRSKMFVCEKCGATFKDNQSEFMNHMANAHPEAEKPSWVKMNDRLSQVITF